MEGFVSGELSAPKKFVKTTTQVNNQSHETLEPNPDYQIWRRADQALLGWMLSSISKEILTQVNQVSIAPTSFQLWTSLAKLFGSQSKAKLMQLKSQFQSTKKDSLSIFSYFCKLKDISDSLAMAGSAVSDEDFIMQLLNGLPLEYDAVVANINSRDSIELEEVQSLLMNQETRIQQATPDIVPVANIVEKEGRKTEYNGGGRGSHNGNARGGFNARGRGRGRGRNSWTNSRTFCQICGRPGHVAYKCYNRFDANFQGPPSNSNTASNNNEFYASPDTLGTVTEWLMDSGATNHITSDTSTMSQKSDYYGGEQLRVGNGQGLNIHHIGSTNYGSLALKNILHVPSITKNLLSIAKIISDNDVIVEFNSCFVFVKDKFSGKVLLQGKLEDGLYKVNFQGGPPISHQPGSFVAISGQKKNSPHCFVSDLSSTQLWHFRLGHPTSLILNKVFQQCNSSLSVNSSCTTFCSSCQLGKSHRLFASPSTNKSSEPLELVFSDVWGPAPVESREGFKYYIVF